MNLSYQLCSMTMETDVRRVYSLFDFSLNDEHVMYLTASLSSVTLAFHKRGRNLHLTDSWLTNTVRFNSFLEIEEGFPELETTLGPKCSRS